MRPTRKAARLGLAPAHRHVSKYAQDGTPEHHAVQCLDEKSAACRQTRQRPVRSIGGRSGPPEGPAAGCVLNPGELSDPRQTRGAHRPDHGRHVPVGQGVDAGEIMGQNAHGLPRHASLDHLENVGRKDKKLATLSPLHPLCSSVVPDPPRRGKKHAAPGEGDLSVSTGFLTPASTRMNPCNLSPFPLSLMNRTTGQQNRDKNWKKGGRQSRMEKNQGGFR